PNADLGDPAQYTVNKFHFAELHRISKGNNAVVAVIDSEIDSNQPNLAGTVSDRYNAGCDTASPHPHGTGMAGAIASHGQLLAVAATDETDRLFNGANQGKYVTVAAPGVDILVPAPNGGAQLTTGTSVATANVSGVAALLIANKPSLKPEEIRAILVATAKHLGSRVLNPT